MKDIYNLGLHDSSFQYTDDGDSYIKVIRVAGGWVYKTETGMAFVPFNDEFQNRKANAIFLTERRIDELENYFDNSNEILDHLNKLKKQLKRLKDEKTNK